ncbi:hypothetical protein MBLNU459_g6157t1 [Dothideomycetes sp. NU459]
MLATSSFACPTPHNFLPVIPSPLSPRRASHARHQPRLFSGFMTSQLSSDTRHSPQTPFSSRPIKPVPTAQKPDALRERRRDIFLKKIKQTRDDSRWEARTEDMARLDYVNQKRRWEAEQARLAPPTYSDPPEEAEVDTTSYLPLWSSQTTAPQPIASQNYGLPMQDYEADAVFQQENEELEALLSLMQKEQQQQQQQQEGTNDAEMQGDTRQDEASVFGSDDEEYDSIFMDFIDDQGGIPSSGLMEEAQDEAMDTT